MTKVDSTCVQSSSHGSLDFLWLELTNRCNLQCKHCYAESGPEKATTGALSCEEYKDIIEQACDVGCRELQFIGGEPTLNTDLEQLIGFACSMGISVEIYTNLTRMPTSLIGCILAADARVATSIYAAKPEIHDEITGVRGSFARTISNLQKLVAAGVETRVSVIEMEENTSGIAETVEMLKGLGIENIGVDHVRPFGRGLAHVDGPELAGLCGACAENVLCIGPSGVVTPCIMSKAWTVGSIRSQKLTDICQSDDLFELRQRISEETSARRPVAYCKPKACAPINCMPNGSSGCRPNTGRRINN